MKETRQYIKCCPSITMFSGLAIMLAVLAFNLVATRGGTRWILASAGNRLPVGCLPGVLCTRLVGVTVIR